MALTQVGADTEITGNDVTSVDTASRTLGTGSNRGLVASVPFYNGSGTVTISSIAFDPTGVNETFTQLGHSGGDYAADEWYRINPSSGASGIFRVTFSGNVGCGVSITEWTDMDQTTPMDGFTGSGTVSGANPSRAVTSRVGDMVVDALISTQALTVGAGQTAQMNVTITAGFIAGSSIEAGAASVTMSWTKADGYYCHAGGNIRAAAAGGTVYTVTVTDGIYMLDPQTKTEDHTLRDNPLLRDLGDPALIRQEIGIDSLLLGDLMTKIEEHTLRDSPLLGDNVIRVLEIIQRDHLLLSTQDVGELLYQIIATDFLFLSDQRISNIDKTIADHLFFLDVMIKVEDKIIRDHLFLYDEATTQIIQNLLDQVITDYVFLLDANIRHQDATQQEGVMLADSPIKELHAVRADSLLLGDERISELLRMLLDSILLRSDRVSGVDLTQTDQLFIHDLYTMVQEKLIEEGLFISDSAATAVATAIVAVLAYARTRSVDLLGIQAGSDDNILGATIGWEIPSD